jgi:Flp pilus assembly protein TadG
VSAKRPLHLAFLSDRRGASAMEFAIVSPLLIVFLFAIITFGWGMHSVSSLRLALEEAGRALQLDPNLGETQLTAMVKDTLGAIGDPNVSVQLTKQDAIGSLKMARITGTYVFDINVPLLPSYHVDFHTGVSVPLRGA